MMVKLENLDDVEIFLKNNNIQFHTMIEDVQKYV